ncbi:hypothetical protein HY483_04170 [Candidatus Woesearchaeota archaeon]|nr:hypothetical protein [Candidatus Woesearchaeota archaeon]
MSIESRNVYLDYFAGSDFYSGLTPEQRAKFGIPPSEDCKRLLKPQEKPTIFAEGATERSKRLKDNTIGQPESMCLSDGWTEW